jgi:tetratricopeptide (TPR) repeat protein
MVSTISLSMIHPAYAADMLPPTDEDNRLVQMAFRDFDLRRFTESEKEFSMSLVKWKELGRPRDEIVSLLKARANVRLDNKDFQGSLEDCNESIKLMSVDGQLQEDGTARYPEYPDTFVARALAKEGLADWSGALDDYNKAVDLWGGGRGEGVNPYVLTFRGNTLGRLNRYSEAIEDYEAASNLFNSQRDVARYSDARANLALALYQEGRTEDAVKAMNDVIRKNPGYADMHVAIAADAWSQGNYILALKVSIL